MIAMGSTLQIHPAAGIPVTAKRAGAALAIVTLSETPLDGIADVVVNMRIGELVERLG
jgi:NAD-dependent deacetylase